MTRILAFSWSVNDHVTRLRDCDYREDGLCVDDLVLFGSGVDVPQTDGVVIRGGEQVAVEVGVPGETVALLLVAPELEVWVTLACD